MNGTDTAVKLLPQRLRAAAESCIADAEEIRLRCGEKMSLLIGDKERATELRVTKDELMTVLERACGASVHSVEYGLARGYIGVSGGIRLGVSGRAVIKDGRVCGMRELSSLNIRIPHEIPGCGDEAFKKTFSDGMRDVLIISPPGGGKTSLLREYIRRLSDAGKRVSVADERGEIAGVYDGIPQFKVGASTDIISGAPKAEAAMMLIRAMSPCILAMDEISTREDAEAVTEASGCGVHILATAHAKDVNELHRKPMLRELLSLGVFHSAVIIENIGGMRSYRLEELAT